MNTREMQDEILRLKKDKGVCILAHAYQSHDIWEVADFVGDSFALSKYAAKAPQDTIMMCGVRFMAETVKVLSPEKTALPEYPSPCVTIRHTFRIPRIPKKNPRHLRYLAEASRTAVAFLLRKIIESGLPKKISIRPALKP